MAFTSDEIKKFQALADEMAKLIEDPDGTSNEASVAYGKIGRVCAIVLSRHAALEAKRTMRTTHATKFKASRDTRTEKVRSRKSGGTIPSAASSSATQQGSQRNRASA